MMRSLYSGVAGLKTHQTRMDVIGNNIANVNTNRSVWALRQVLSILPLPHRVPHSLLATPLIS